MADFSHIHDILGQLPLLKSYSHLLLAFPISDTPSCRESTVARLKAAVLELTISFPWLAAQVINVGSSAGNSGLFHLAPCALWSPPNSILRVKDRSDLCPSYAEIDRSRAPISMLDGDILSPRKAFPESYHESESDPAPVLALQANFIKGGLLLDCAAQHNFMDMGAIDQFLQLLATAMRGERFTSTAVEQGNRDRRNMIPLLRSEEVMQDHSHFRRPLVSDGSPPLHEPDSPFSWRYFRFSSTNLARLKAIAAKSEGYDTSVPFISTNDALLAFCWQRIISIRLKRHDTPQAIAKILRAVDARKAMGVTREFMGELVIIATSEMSFKDLASSPLSTVACGLRKDVEQVNTQNYIRSFATLIAKTPDKSTIVYSGTFNPDTDIGSSSWAHIELSRVSFGPLGRPGYVRRPDFVPLKSDIYFMPQTDAGDVDALMCFNEEDMTGLKMDEVWTTFAEYIG